MMASGVPLITTFWSSQVARDLVFDSVSVATTFKEELGRAGVLFMSISEAVHKFPELVKKHLGTVVSLAAKNKALRLWGITQ